MGTLHIINCIKQVSIYTYSKIVLYQHKYINIINFINKDIIRDLVSELLESVKLKKLS